MSNNDHPDNQEALEKTRERAAPTELTGGAGFSYEDWVAAYYLAALLKEEGAAPQLGAVVSVAVQQAGHGHPMDDVIVGFSSDGGSATVGLQVKRRLTLSAADRDFADVIAKVVATRKSPTFDVRHDRYGLAAEHISDRTFRSLERLIDWAKASPTGDHFLARFGRDGSAAATERRLRDDLLPLLNVTTADGERDFYAHFVALKLDGLGEGGALRTEVVNRLGDLVAGNEEGQKHLLFDRLCRIARNGAATAAKWTRSSLLAELRGTIRLTVAPAYRRDLERLTRFSQLAIADIGDDIAGCHIERLNVEQRVTESLAQARLVNLTGLPGCGKSAVQKRLAIKAADTGPILFLKSDRLEGRSWSTFAARLGLERTDIGDLLVDIGSAGTPVLFIDGIDRVPPDRRGIITDILHVIETDQRLRDWKVLATSRHAGLEPFRTWVPASFYREAGIADVGVEPLSDEEAETLAAERPELRRLLFGAPGVREIARRPFFAAVLARQFPSVLPTPQSEIDLIRAWWNRAGHDTAEAVVPARQRALIDLATTGVRTLGRSMPLRLLKDTTFQHAAALKSDLIVRESEDGAAYAFAHDIFFEWSFFRHLVELGDDWIEAARAAGEPPLLGRIVGLLAQSMLATPGRWSSTWRRLSGASLRPQWQREWLTAPPFSPAFAQEREEVEALLRDGDWALLGKQLVWFQAQHTIPNPVLLRNPALSEIVGDRVALAEGLGWPSDGASWGRLIDWLLPLAGALPGRLVPALLGVFEVWQNALADLTNARSTMIVDQAGSWLLELEGAASDEGADKWKGLGRESREHLVQALRAMVLRGARGHRGPALALVARATTNRDVRRDAYNDIMTYAPTLADVAPDALAALAKAELMTELPADRLARERREREARYAAMERIRALPAESRSPLEQRMLDHVPFSFGSDYQGFDDLGIDEHHTFYFPTSPAHEPFSALFARAPTVGLALVRDLANHATMAWRQGFALHREQKRTPLPVRVDFPWGRQELWGGWKVYSWGLGQLAPQPLECAFLALAHWAFKEIESGTPVDDIVRAVVEGSTCYASLGLALRLALETGHVSATTLPLVTCQRLWEHDLARHVQEPMRDVDITGLGIDKLTKLSGAKAKAKEFLDGRLSRGREIRELVMRFALSGDETLRRRCKEALAAFPMDLPYEFEDERGNAAITAELQVKAARWAGLGDRANYRKQAAGENGWLISYAPPAPPSASELERLRETGTFFSEQRVVAWAVKSLNSGGLDADITLADAIVFARERDLPDLFDVRLETGEHMPQSTVSAVAAVVIALSAADAAERAWAWDVMDRVARMREPSEFFPGAKIPWHPALHLIAALARDRRSPMPRASSTRTLFELTSHFGEQIVDRAFDVLLSDPDDHVRWTAGALAIESGIWRRPPLSDEGARQSSRPDATRLARALERLESGDEPPFLDLPAAWVQVHGEGRRGRAVGWDEPDTYFCAGRAAELLGKLPIEAWCCSEQRRPHVDKLLRQLVTWTSERLMPSWASRRDCERGASELGRWCSQLGDLLARAAPYFTAEDVRKNFLQPFLVEDEEALDVLAPFAHYTVLRQVFDAPVMPANTIELLDLAVTRVLADPVFRVGSYRAGKVHGWEMPKLLRALLLVNIDETAPGAARFANGNWAEIACMMPIVTRVVTSIGWSVFVMDAFLTLCERSGAAYPLAAFTRQAEVILGSIANAGGSWTGTTLPARTAATIQRLADSNYPLRVEAARTLLRVLDALIDLGDRRSASLEQSEAFRGIQG